MLRYFPLFFISIAFFLSAGEDQAVDDEALFARRIIAFWKDRELEVCKHQIERFLASYPNSAFNDHFRVVLADAYRAEKQYQKALSVYEAIASSEILASCRSQRIDCLFQAERFTAIVEELEAEMLETDWSQADKQQQRYALKLVSAYRMLDEKSANERAKQLLQTLLSDAACEEAAYPLVDIYKACGDDRAAVELLFDLADKEKSHNKENLLYQAALLQARFDEEQALLTFSEVQHINGEKKAAAAKAKFLLLAQLKRYDQILKEKDLAASIDDADCREVMQYLTGMSYLRQNQAEAAYTILDQLAAGSENTVAEAASLGLIAAAYDLGKDALLSDISERYLKTYPNADGGGSARFFRAMALKKQKKWDKALDELDDIEQLYPSYDKLEAVCYEKALCLFALKRFDESYEQLMRQLMRFPNGEYRTRAIYLAPKATLALLKDRSEDTHLCSRLINDLEFALEIPGIMPIDQQHSYALTLANAYYRQGDSDKCKRILLNIVRNPCQDETTASAHLLLAQCYKEEEDANDSFIQHSEQALLILPKHPEAPKVHLNLFNAYIQRANENATDAYPEKKKAAQHLYAAIRGKKNKVKRAHCFWLADFFYSELASKMDRLYPTVIEEKNDKKLAKKTLQLYRLCLQIKEGKALPDLPCDAKQAQTALYHMSQLYAWLDKQDSQEKMLVHVKKNLQSSSEQESDLLALVCFQLGLLANNKHSPEEAIAYFETPKHFTDSYLSVAATLEQARVRLTAGSKLGVQAPLSDLKALSEKRRIENEPLHIEAALDFARWDAQLSKERKEDAYLLRLKAFKENYFKEKDIASKDYHALRRLNQEKGAIIDCYLLFIDSEIARLEASLAAEQGEKVEEQWKKEAAESLLRELKDKGMLLTPYLKQQLQVIQESMQ